ncbi:MAG: Verru_Chthon cassette protein D [Verrucomicrobiales bacterium]|nr:Verru_Chthon cassette protein D [Verrucomicrobiales bacterium]MCP5559441.1 Verru_Chthon cassette protein D [Verrucomicrobiaceae bacterium]
MRLITETPIQERAVGAFRRGFTLIEMLVVLAIMAMMIAIVTPAFIGVIRSTQMTSTGDAIVNAVNMAQQEAIASNLPVELRFYTWEENGGSRNADVEQNYHAYQVVRLGKVGQRTLSTGSNTDYAQVEAVADPVVMDSGIVVMKNKQYSPLLQSQFKEGQNLFTRADADYSAIRFYPDGSVKTPKTAANGGSVEAGVVPPNLPESYFTVADAREAGGSGDLKNFYCIQIDPYTAKSRVYRPDQ